MAESFGKIIFIPTSRRVPPLPEMKLLICKSEDTFMPYRALCIDLEMDAAGDSIETACDNLKNSLNLYLRSEIDAWGSVQAAARHITDAAYEETAKKSADFKEYRRMKHAYIQSLINKNAPVDLLKREINELTRFEAKKKLHNTLPFITAMTEPRAA